jgi:transcriptional regulator with XRE-family HTH domain
VSNLGKRIRRARLLMDLEQKDLAKKAGLTIPYLSQIENGHVDPRFSVVLRLADILDVSLDFLADKEEVRR